MGTNRLVKDHSQKSWSIPERSLIKLAADECQQSVSTASIYKLSHHYLQKTVIAHHGWLETEDNAGGSTKKTE